jgi:hypothetical protein
MKPNRMKEKLRAGERVFGASVKYHPAGGRGLAAGTIAAAARGDCEGRAFRRLLNWGQKNGRDGRCFSRAGLPFGGPVKRAN